LRAATRLLLALLAARHPRANTAQQSALVVLGPRTTLPTTGRVILSLAPGSRWLRLVLLALGKGIQTGKRRALVTLFLVIGWRIASALESAAFIERISLGH
jgi:hypothetical protein